MTSINNRNAFSTVSAMVKIVNRSFVYSELVLYWNQYPRKSCTLEESFTEKENKTEKFLFTE